MTNLPQTLRHEMQIAEITRIVRLILDRISVIQRTETTEREIYQGIEAQLQDLAAHATHSQANVQAWVMQMDKED